MELYNKNYRTRTEFFSTCDPDQIEESLIAYLRKLKIEPLISKEKYKIKFTRTGLNEFSNEIEDNVEACVRILRVDDENAVAGSYDESNSSK